MTPAFQRGREDRRNGKTGKANPYENQHCRDQWMDGWLAEDGPNIGLCYGCLVEDAILIDGRYCEQCAAMLRPYQRVSA